VDSIAITPDQSVTQITDHLARVRDRVAHAARQSGRSADDVTIVAVSKRHSAAAVRAAYDAGQRDFGENFVQEAVDKITALNLPDAKWHFIGRIQANKTRDIARYFDWAHTVDRAKIARRLSEHRAHYAPPLNVCIQVNLGAEPQKGGVAPEELPALVAELRSLPKLCLRGLMTMPPASAGPDALRDIFAELARLERELVRTGVPLDTLSMGMSGDLDVAVECGSTMVRIGTAIFGERSPDPAEDTTTTA
jgi:pyridoxal phosphate enzyme (YggS family)